MKALKNLKKVSEKVIEHNPEIEEAAEELFVEVNKFKVNGEFYNNNFEDIENNCEEHMNESNDNMNID
jgi:uncharacterized protein (DUF2164 family)